MSNLSKLVLALVFALGIIMANTAKAEDEQADVQGLLKMFESINVGFYLDSTYAYDFNSPDSGEIGARSLYPDDNAFKINAFTLSLEKTPTVEGDLIDHLGFRTDILFGDQADLLNPQGINSDAVSPYQAYIDVMPVEGLDIYFGQFVTLAGFEVIEAKNDPNISRSILFGYAIPFTHTGVRAKYAKGPFSAIVGVNNGWDTWENSNDGKTIETQLGLSGSNDTLSSSLYVTGYFGKENDGFNTDDWRELITAVGSLGFGPVTLYADLDFGWQDNVQITEGGDFINAFWWGVAGYIVYDIHPAVTLALRGEYFDDSDGFRGFGTKLWEITPTVSFKPFKGMANKELTEYLDNFEFRVEYRYDKADDPIFEDHSDFKDSQNTVMAQALYWINL